MKVGEGKTGDRVKIRCTVDGKQGRKGTIVEVKDSVFFIVQVDKNIKVSCVSCDLELINK